jgi:hypothetical protein
VAKLAAMLRTEDLAAVMHRLAGVFGLFVHDGTAGPVPAGGAWQVAVDNAGLYKVYHDAEGVGTSFLELARARRVGRGRIDPEAVVEYLAHGSVFGSRTLVTGVGELLWDEVLELPADGSAPRRRAKSLPTAAPGDTRLVLERFARLARSLQGRSFSADATGGFDTRLIVCVLDRNGVPFELATSGQPDTAETEIAREMARLLRRPFHLQGHDLDDFDTQVEATFRAGDGLTDVRRFHRDRQNAQARLARGIEVFAHGGGGELFRDHYFIQDFPFYGSSRINFPRYYDLRMTPVPLPPECLSPAGRESLGRLRAATIARFEELRAPTNNESYDRTYYYLRSPEFYGHYFSNYINMGLDVVAPLLDYETALSAMAHPPWGRFFFLWHRRVITEHRPDVAALPSAEGFSASSEPLRMLKDVRGFGTTQLRRVGKKVSQRVTGRARFHTVGAFVADAPGYMGLLRASPHFSTAVERLADAGILAPRPRRRRGPRRPPRPRPHRRDAAGGARPSGLKSSRRLVGVSMTAVRGSSCWSRRDTAAESWGCRRENVRTLDGRPRRGVL